METKLLVCLYSRLGTNNTAMIKISAPIKTHWAGTHDLDFEELMSAGEYKEEHRQDMIKWSEQIRQKDYGYFCQAAVEMFNGTHFYIQCLFSEKGDTGGNKFRFLMVVTVEIAVL
jgi:phosphomevalonate kinase